MDFPIVTGSGSFATGDVTERSSTPATTAAPAVAPVALAGTAPGDAECQDMWQYFVDHVDEFAVAKSIVDYFEANPKDLHSDRIEVDAFALFLRAKISIKREQIAYAAAQAAIERQRLQRRSIKGLFGSLTRHLDEMRRAIVAQPQVLAAMAASGVVVLYRLS